jgi:hypothetical protein
MPHVKRKHNMSWRPRWYGRIGVEEKIYLVGWSANLRPAEKHHDHWTVVLKARIGLHANPELKEMKHDQLCYTV